MENKGLVLESIHNLLYPLKEDTTLQDTATPDFKEGLVVYFTNLNSEYLKKIDDKLNSNNNKKITLPKPSNPKFYGEKSFESVNLAIKHLIEDSISDSKEISLYNNALSIAKLIQSIYKKPVQADRGIDYQKIRSKAKELTKNQGLSVWVDKWCPADIYIYNDSNSIRMAQQAKFLNIDEKSLNAIFQSDINDTSTGITGISLKEETARGGAAGSFTKNLTRKENYQDAPTLSGQSIRIRSIVTSYNGAKNSISNGETTMALAKIATAHASTRALSKLKKYNGINSIITDFENIIKRYVPKLGKNRRGNFESSVILKIPKQKIKSVELPSTLDQKLQRLFSSVRADSEKEYTNARKNFLNVLKSTGYNPPESTPSFKQLDDETLLKKAGCYLVGSFIIDGLDNESLVIPSEFQTIMTQKNAFVALTAYAIGMAGISPTFFKMIGDSKGKNAKVETFDGSGFLNLTDKSDVIIKDSDENKGFSVEFITKVTIQNKPNSKVLKRYKVVMQFVYGGDQIKIEVSELKEK